MRPRYAPNGPYEAPRRRARRVRDLRDLSVAYAIAIVVNIGVVTAMATHPEWLSADVGDFMRALRILLAVGIYIGSGALLVALVTHRIAAWDGNRSVRVRPTAWRVLLVWPLYVGALLLTLTEPMRGGRY